MKTKIKVLFFTAVFTVFLLFSGIGSAYGQGPTINMKYLDSRMAKIKTSQGKTLTIWKTDDKDLQNRKIQATTFETALVTRVYLTHYMLFQDGDSLKKARDGVAFLFHMQTDKGTYYNYLLENGSIDKTSSESLDNLGEHTAQAYLTMGQAATAFRKGSVGDYSKIESSFLQTTDSLKKWMDRPEHEFGKFNTHRNISIPAWLIEGRGDLTAVYLLGMTYFHEASPMKEVSDAASKLAHGIIKFKNPDPETYPSKVHLSFSSEPNVWITEGAFQTSALARGAMIFERSEWMDEAMEEAVGFLARFPASYGPMEGFFPFPVIYPQTPMGAYTLTSNFSLLAEASKQEKYYKLAGLCAAWFFRNNSAGHPIYSNDTGACGNRLLQSGIDDTKSLKGSACALLSMMAIYRSRGYDMLSYKPKSVHAFRIFESKDGIAVDEDLEISEFEFFNGKKEDVVNIQRRNIFWHKFKIDVDDEYSFLMTFLKQSLFPAAVAVNVRVDGGPIILIPHGGSGDEQYMVMQHVTEPVELIPGPHTVGVRYKGLLYTKPAVIRCLVLRPGLERKILTNDKGQSLMIIKNWLNKRNNMPLQEDLKDVMAETTGLDGRDSDEPITVEKNHKYLSIPAEGIGIMQW